MYTQTIPICTTNPPILTAQRDGKSLPFGTPLNELRDRLKIKSESKADIQSIKNCLIKPDHPIFWLYDKTYFACR